MANKKVNPIPEGCRTVTPSFCVKDAKKAMEFYKKAFGAKVVHEPCLMPNGKIGHMELQIGDSKLMMSEEFPEMGWVAPKGGGLSNAFYLYFNDCDPVFKAAVAAGGKQVMPLADQFWGDRMGVIVDPFGHQWSIATHKEDLTPEQMDKRMKESLYAASK